MNQKAFAPIFILIGLAAFAVIGVITYGVYITGKKTSPAPVPQIQSSSPELTAPLGTPECPELDYTGCDTSGEFMTWTDDGLR
jgi:hypothetical protein